MNLLVRYGLLMLSFLFGSVIDLDCVRNTCGMLTSLGGALLYTGLYMLARVLSMLQQERVGSDKQCIGSFYLNFSSRDVRLEFLLYRSFLLAKDCFLCTGTVCHQPYKYIFSLDLYEKPTHQSLISSMSIIVTIC